MSQTKSQSPCLKRIRETFLKADFFANSELLKYRGEGAYQTYTGATLSVLLFLAFFIGFFSMIKSTLSRENITSVPKSKPSKDSQFETNSSSSAFMFAVGLEGFDLSAQERMFDIFMTAKVYKNSKPFSSVDIPLQPCTLEQWAGISDQLNRTYTRLNFNQWLCPSNDFNFIFKGKFSSEEFKYANIVVKKCSGKLGGTCANSSTFTSALYNHETFKLNVYFANPIIDPSEKEYLDYSLEDTIYFEFTDMLGVRSHIFFSEYEVNTDKSIWPEPLTDITIDRGLTISERPVVSNFEIINTEEYVKISLLKSDLIQQFDRSYTRMDVTFAYLGGLFGMTLIIFYGMMAYSEYAFEFQIGGELFVYNDKKEFQTGKFHIFTFPFYLVYCIVTFFYPDAQTWGCFSFYRKVDECREEVKEQTDVCFLIKRVIYIEKAIELFFNSRLDELTIDHKWTIDEASQKRNFYDNHKKIEQMIKTSEKKGTNVKKRMEVQPSHEEIIVIDEEIPRTYRQNDEYHQPPNFDEVHHDQIKIEVEELRYRDNQDGSSLNSIHPVHSSPRRGSSPKVKEKESKSAKSSDQSLKQSEDNKQNVPIADFNLGQSANGRRLGLKVTKK